ncbi:MAG: protein BatD [Bryobacteraceae bacterium]|nr:protein BatD [Bryobacteraceae bacterium]
MGAKLGAGLLLLTAFAAGAAAQQLSVQAVVEKQDVFAGEPFLLQIQVEGSDAPEKPDLSGLAGVTVQDLGGQQNSSESVTIINNQVTRVTRRGYVFSYRLTAQKPGTFTIPPIAIQAGGKTLRTAGATIRATPPAESDDFKLRLSLSERKAYAGQPVILTITWYVGQNVQDFSFTVPVLNDKRFTIEDPRIQIDPDRHLEIALPNGKAIGEKGEATLDGRRFLTVELRKILIPRQPGTIAIEPATVAGKARPNRARNPFADDFFGFATRMAGESFVAGSNRAAIEVMELPQAGRPATFSGLVGQYRIAAEATPAEVSVGDPITLNVRVSGPEYLANAQLPPLTAQPALARDFRIPAEQAAGVLEGNVKKFTQTIRAIHPDVREIPPIELSYFNPKSGGYEIARTAPIPLAVKGTRIVTAQDAEGAGRLTAQTGVESREGGIAYNYEGPDALINQALGGAAPLGSPAWLIALGLPPLCFAALLGYALIERRREVNPGERTARRAYKDFSRRASALPPSDSDGFHAAMLEATRNYLGARLALPAQALTFLDVKPSLEQRGMAADLVEAVKRLFERCEAGRYAGSAAAGENAVSLKNSAIETIGGLERALSQAERSQR